MHRLTSLSLAALTILGLSLAPLASAGATPLGGPEVPRYSAGAPAPSGAPKATYNANAQARPLLVADTHSDASDRGGTLTQPPAALGPAPFDLGKIARIQVGTRSVREKPLRVGNLDVLAPLVEELPLVGARVTSADPRNIPGNLNTPSQDQFFQINLPHGAPIVMAAGKSVAWIDGNQVTLRSAPLIIDRQIWLPVFSIAPLMGAATRLNPQGTLFLTPTIQSVELFPFDDTVAVTIKTSMPVPPGAYRIKDGKGTNPTSIEFSGFSMGFDAGNSTMERLVAPGRGDVKGVRAAQGAFFPDMTRVVIDFKKPLDATVQSVPDPTIFAMVLTPPRQPVKILKPKDFNPDPPIAAPGQPVAPNTPLSKPLQGMTIIVDAGHGGHDSGARGSNSREKDYTLDIAKRLATYLAQRGANALLSRPNDNFVTLKGRVDFANSRNADLFISIHMNASTSKASNGTETFYSTSQSQFLAKEIHREFVGATGRKNRGVSQARFYVIRNTWMPSVLLECAFVSNPTEEKIASDPQWRERVAQGVTRGVINYVTKYGGKGSSG